MIDFKRLRTQFTESTDLKGLFSALLELADELSTPTNDILTKTDILNAEGAQIDLNGEDLGIQRQGLSDADYILLQFVQVLANTADGTADKFIKIIQDFAELATDEASPTLPFPVTAFEDFPAKFSVNLTTSIKPEFEGLLKTLKSKARGTGIGARVSFSGEALGDGSNDFAFNTGPGFNNGHLKGVV